MQKNWQVRRLTETLIIVQPAHLYPRELSALSSPLKEGDIDQLLADPLFRNVLFEIYETINGKTIHNVRSADAEHLRKSVRPRLVEAFRHRELVALRIPRSSLSQIVSEEEESEAAVPVKDEPSRRILPTSWIEIKLLDAEGQPVPREKYRIKFPDGTVEEHRLNEFGEAEHYNIREGTCEIFFPDLDRDSWERDQSPAFQQSKSSTHNR